jgi:hypothetical protein
LLSAASAWTQVLNLPTTPVIYYADGGDHITGFFDVKLSNVPPGFSVSNGEIISSLDISVVSGSSVRCPTCQ